MEETGQAEFYSEVSAADATSTELDPRTCQLLTGLRDMDVQSANLTKFEPASEGSPTEGTKKK